MKARASAMGGLCILEEEQPPQLVSVADMTVIEPAIAHLVAGVVDDWESLEAPDRATLLSDAKDLHIRARCLANVESCLGGVSSELEAELLAEVEDILKASGAHRQLLAMLLRAPLVSLDCLEHMIHGCLSGGYGATAAILEQVRELQPHLQRLSDRWLSIPEECFTEVPGGRQEVWRMAVVSEIALQTMQASDFPATEKAWKQLVFDFSSPPERTAMAGIAKAVAQALWPDYVDASTVALTQDADPEERQQQPAPDGHDARLAYERALKQVDGIADAVSQGHDARARKYLRELVDSQLAYVDGQDHVIKSLCNIAQQCAEMFRTDFEYECLQLALEIRDTDHYALVQLGDHYKRVGDFERAIDTLEKARHWGGGEVAESCRADVHVQMGDFEEALRIYDGILQGEYSASARMGRADALRRAGRFEEAKVEYDRILGHGSDEDRAVAGLAEIAKRRGQLGEARRLYEDMLRYKTLDDKAKWHYELALANVCLRQGDLRAAYELADGAVQERPFARFPRALRAGIAGLLGDAERAIGDLPHLGQAKAFREWVSDYVRGLLLLMLRRFDDAREALVQTVEQRLLDKDADAILRLGAAVCFLRHRGDIERASAILQGVPNMEDAFADAIRDAFAYHVAVALGKADEIARLEKQLASVEDEGLNDLRAAISRRDWRAAWDLEVRVLLRLAA